MQRRGGFACPLKRGVTDAANSCPAVNVLVEPTLFRECRLGISGFVFGSLKTTWIHQIGFSLRGGCIWQWQLPIWIPWVASWENSMSRRVALSYDHTMSKTHCSTSLTGLLFCLHDGPRTQTVQLKSPLATSFRKVYYTTVLCLLLEWDESLEFTKFVCLLDVCQQYRWQSWRLYSFLSLTRTVFCLFFIRISVGRQSRWMAHPTSYPSYGVCAPLKGSPY